MRQVRVATPTTSLGGRRFQPGRELALHGLVERVAVALPGEGDVILIPEMPSPLGLPDFLAAIGVGRWLQRRREAEVPPVLSEIDCTLLAALNHKAALRPSTIARRSGWHEAEVERTLARLLRSGAALETPTGTLLRHPALEPEGTLIAIETKHDGWRRAVRQGRGYRTWASNYVVVLGEVGGLARSRAAAETRDDGAGLFNGAGWITRPTQRQPTKGRRILGMEYLFAAVGSDPTL